MSYKQTAFGYQQPDGSVKYGLIVKEYSFDRLIDIIKNKKLPDSLVIDCLVKSQNSYLSAQRSVDEDTECRVLYRLDGSTLCRDYSLKGDLILTAYHLDLTE